jgi:hypothetical protein
MTTTYPIQKKIYIMGQEVEMIQFKPNELINFRINAKTEAHAECILKYLYMEDMLNKNYI